MFARACYCFSVGVRYFLGEAIEHYTKYSPFHSSSTIASTNAQRRCKCARTPPWSVSVALKILYFRHYATAYSAPGIILVPVWSRWVFASLTNRRSISSRAISRTPLSPQFLPAMVWMTAQPTLHERTESDVPSLLTRYLARAALVLPEVSYSRETGTRRLLPSARYCCLRAL